MTDRSDWACKGDPVECDFEAAAGHYLHRYELAVEVLDRVLEALEASGDDSATQELGRKFLRLSRTAKHAIPITHRIRFVGQIWEEHDGEMRWRDIPDEVKGRTEWARLSQAKYFRDLLSDSLKTLHPREMPPVTRIIKRTVSEELVLS